MTEILLFSLIAFCGMLVQSFVGFAGSLIAVPLFALFLSPKEAVPTYSLVMLVVDLWLVFEARHHIQWHRVGKMLIGGLIGIPIGAYGLKHLPTTVIELLICTVTLVFAVLFLFKVKVRLKEDTATQVGIGLMSGLLGGGISASGPPVVIYGLARAWDKNTFRTTLVTYFTCLCMAANLCYWSLGLFVPKSLAMFSVAVVPTCVAGLLGVFLKNRVSEKIFRAAVLTIIIMVSLIALSRVCWSG